MLLTATCIFVFVKYNLHRNCKITGNNMADRTCWEGSGRPYVVDDDGSLLDFSRYLGENIISLNIDKIFMTAIQTAVC